MGEIFSLWLFSFLCLIYTLFGWRDIRRKRSSFWERNDKEGLVIPSNPSLWKNVESRNQMSVEVKEKDIFVGDEKTESLYRRRIRYRNFCVST
uniref:Uncharacterized protein n=1 Tax=Manihot esculenta TaxID=3983 RepID=A0A2C9UIX7_MANES